MSTHSMAAGIGGMHPIPPKGRRFASAVEARIASRIAPEHLRAGAAASRMRGHAARAAGRVREALRHFEEAHRAAPRHPLLARELALTLRDAGELDRAMVLLRLVVDSGHASVALLVELADLQRIARVWAEAETTIARALMIAPHDVDARLSHAHLMAARGESIRAAAAYGALCEDVPEDCRPWRHRGLLAFHLGEMRDARRWLAKSLELEPAHSMTWFALGRSCAAAGLSMRAVDCFDRALALNAASELVASERDRLCRAASNPPCHGGA